jgi:hypothetical protein
MEKKMSKKSFLLHHDSLDVLDALSDEQAGKLFKAIRNYQMGHDIELDSLLNIVFIPFKNQFIRDGVKYDGIVERNTINGAKGGRPKKSKDNPKNPSGYLETQDNPSEPKKADSDSDSDNVNESVNEKETVIDNVNESVNEKETVIDNVNEPVSVQEKVKQKIRIYVKKNNIEPYSVKDDLIDTFNSDIFLTNPHNLDEHELFDYVLLLNSVKLIKDENE